MTEQLRGPVFRSLFANVCLLFFTVKCHYSYLISVVRGDRDRWRALVNAIMNLRVPENAGKLWSGFTTGGLSCSVQLHTASLISCSWLFSSVRTTFTLSLWLVNDTFRIADYVEIEC
jgi:hypothetical protein